MWEVGIVSNYAYKKEQATQFAWTKKLGIWWSIDIDIWAW